MAKHSPDQIASLAAMLLQGRHDAEAHNVKAAVATARLILDEAHAGSAEDPEPRAPAKAPAKA